MFMCVCWLVITLVPRGAWARGDTPRPTRLHFPPGPHSHVWWGLVKWSCRCSAAACSKPGGLTALMRLGVKCWNWERCGLRPIRETKPMPRIRKRVLGQGARPMFLFGRSSFRTRWPKQVHGAGIQDLSARHQTVMELAGHRTPSVRRK